MDAYEAASEKIKPWSISFTVHGFVMPWQRHIGTGASARTPGKTRAFEEQVKWSAKAAMAKASVTTTYEAVVLWIDIYHLPPPSWSQKKKGLALSNQLPCAPRIDIDNQVKALFDGMNTIVYADDHQVVGLHVNRRFAEREGAQVRAALWTPATMLPAG